MTGTFRAVVLLALGSAPCGCVPDPGAGVGGGDTGRIPIVEDEVCEVGEVRDFVDDGGVTRPAYLRGVDGAVLVAHFARPADVPDGFPSRNGAGAAPTPCSASAVLDVADLVLGDRELTVACGGAALAPRTVQVAADWRAAFDHARACDDASWIWLWTPRTCHQLLARLPTTSTGPHQLLPYRDRATERTEAYCSVEGTVAWTRVLWIEGTQAEIEEMDLEPARDLVTGLRLARDRRGSVAASQIVLDPQNTFLSFRFECLKSIDADLDDQLSDLDFETDSAAVARAIVSDDGDEVRRPLAPGFSRFLEPEGKAGMLGRPTVWGSVVEPGPEWPAPDDERRVTHDFAGRWTLGAAPLLDLPFFVASSALPNPAEAERGWSIRKGDLRCGDAERGLHKSTSRARWTVDVR